MNQNYEKIKRACQIANPKLMEFKKPTNYPYHRKIDMTGVRFAKLVGVGEMPERGKDGTVYWLFKCDCGKEKVASGLSVRNGGVRSCGCLRSIVRIHHGLTSSPTYKTWSGMKARCLNTDNSNYPNYGGRGITVCERWLKFENFLADMGHKPKGMTLDRIDVNGDYSLSNCRWTTMKAQQNNRRNNKLLTYNNITLTMAQWADKVGLNYKTLKARIRNGWELERALKPVKDQSEKTLQFIADLL